jgi:hypothetical protein
MICDYHAVIFHLARPSNSYRYGCSFVVSRSNTALLYKVDMDHADKVMSTLHDEALVGTKAVVEREN